MSRFGFSTKRTLGFFAAVVSFAVLQAGCAPSASQLKKVVEENPDILYGAIEKDPAKFLEVVNKAVHAAQMKGREDEAKAETERMENEFKNPLTPKIEGRHAFGNENAPVTIVKYFDFLCGHCATANETIKEVRKEFGDKVKVVYKNLPIFSPEAATYFEAVMKQDPAKAEKFKDELFSHRGDLQSKREAYLESAAKKVGANMTQLKKDVASQEIKDLIEADTNEAKGFGFSGTPAFVINGVSLRGAYPLPKFKEIIERQLAAKKE